MTNKFFAQLKFIPGVDWHRIPGTSPPSVCCWQ